MRYRWNPPPYWPEFPADFEPSPAWRPEPEWALPPVGWSFWTWPSGRPAPGPAGRYGAQGGPVGFVRRHKAAAAAGFAALVVGVLQIPGTDSEDLAVASVSGGVLDLVDVVPDPVIRGRDAVGAPDPVVVAPPPPAAAPEAADQTLAPALERILRPRPTLGPTRSPARGTYGSSVGAATGVAAVPAPAPVPAPEPAPAPPGPLPTVDPGPGPQPSTSTSAAEPSPTSTDTTTTSSPESTPTTPTEAPTPLPTNPAASP